MPKVSIIVPCYNAEQYLEECLSSIVAQTLDDIEVLLFNDGSTDGTANILDVYEKRYRFIRVVSQQNCGIFNTRAKAIEMATGEYIGWVDADDFVAPQMFEVLYRAAVENESELVYCSYDWYPHKVSEKAKWFREYKGKKDVDYVERNSQFWNKLVKKELLIRCGIGEMLPKCFEESMIIALLEAKNPISIDRQLYFYRVGHTSMSAKYKNIDYYKGFVNASKELAEYTEPLFPDKYWRDYFSFRISYYLLMSAIVAANAGDKKEYKSAIAELNIITPRYTKNQHFRSILESIYSQAKTIFISTVVPRSYFVTRLVCKVFFK